MNDAAMNTALNIVETAPLPSFRVAVLNSTVVPESVRCTSEGAARAAIQAALEDPTATYVALYLNGEKVEAHARPITKPRKKGEVVRVPAWKRLK